MNILLCDDHPIVREGLRKVLVKQPDINFISEAGSGKEALEKLKEQQIDVVLLDIKLPDMNGIEVLHKIKVKYPKTHVIMLTMFEPEEYGMPAIQEGALCYLTKAVDTSELIHAIRTVAKGEAYIIPALGKILANKVNKNNSAGQDIPLSEREFEIMIKLGRGKSLTEISKELQIDYKTVHSYQTRLMMKQNFKSKSELTDYCIKNRLL